MRRLTASLALALLAAGAAARAQAPSRVPIIAGNGAVHVLVNVDGTVSTWGRVGVMDPGISLGDGVKPSASHELTLPRPLPGITDIVGVAVSISHALLLKRDGTVLAWGDNDDCQLGNPVEKSMHAPVPVPGLHGVKQVAAAEGVSGAVLEDGTVRIWGSGYTGLLGNGQFGRAASCAKTPVKVEGLTGVTRLSLDAAALALTEDGTVWGWGVNDGGGFCDGTTERRGRPAPITGIGKAVDAVTSGNSYFVLADGTVRTCGKGGDSLGDPAPRGKPHLTPFQVPGITTARSVQVYADTAIVRLADGTLRGWGNGYFGSLGDGHGDQSSPRVHQPIGLGPVLAHYMSGASNFAIRADGTVLAWGIPAESGPTTFVLKPTPVFTVKVSP